MPSFAPREDPLSIEASQQRYATEREQGEALLRDGFEAAWGWSGPAGERRAERRASFLIEAAHLRPGVECLELGCGTGEFTARLARSRCDITGVELSSATAEACRRRLGPDAEVVVGNVETAEGLDGRSFDAIVGVSVLHHVNLDLALRRTVVPLLKRGGRFAFSEPNIRNPQVWAERHIALVGRARHTTPHETAFRAEELREQFEAAGLEVDVCEPFDFLHPSTPRRLISFVTSVEARLERSAAKAIAGSVRIAGHRP
jgi:2-polyprenyl-3-methyl-5-hydroxy-6-metoxy-1,4-benzoquinol methylase